MLQKFEQGVEEYSERVEIEGQSFFRYMKVLRVQKGCLKCHAVQGYKEGDVRGGISIATPMAANRTIELSNLLHSYLVYLLLWILGFGGISYGSIHLQKQLNIRKEAEAEKERLQSQILQSQKLESIGQLAAGIAHEINTPAQFLGTNMEFLAESFQDMERLMKEYQTFLQAVEKEEINPAMVKHLQETVEELDWGYLVEEIPLTIRQSQEGVERISTIVGAMKEFSHPGSKKKAPVNLNDIINTTMTVASNEWKYIAEIELNLAPDLPSVTCLADEMGQVFLNILVNAAHAIGEKLGDNPEGKKGLITISSQQKAEWIEIRITDNGNGMADSVRDHIFDPFFTTKEVGKGSGQGLAIAYSVVTDKHQGILLCEGEEGAGTQFSIRLPINT